MSNYKISRLLTSQRGESGADHLLARLSSGALQMDILPNNYPRYTGQLEEEDYLSYGRFLRAMNGQKILAKLEEQDGSEYSELFRSN